MKTKILLFKASVMLSILIAMSFFAKQLMAQIVGDVSFGYGVEAGTNLVSLQSPAYATAAYNWHWDFGDGQTEEQAGTTSFNTTHTYTDPGVYLVCLTVIDPQMNDISYNQQTCKYIPVNINLKSADFTYTSLLSLKYGFTVNDSSFDNHGSLLYLWDFGDGETLSEANIETQTLYMPVSLKV